MICPKCKLEYLEGYTKCPECGETLVENANEKKSDGDKGFFQLGVTTAKKAISLLFFLGLLPVLYSSILFGNYLYLTNTYSKGVEFMQDGQKVYTEVSANNSTLGVFGGFAFFVVVTLIWKVLCELMIIIFRAIETYTQKNKVQ